MSSGEESVRAEESPEREKTEPFHATKCSGLTKVHFKRKQALEPTHKKIPGSIPGQSTHLDCGFLPWLG